LWLGSLSSAAGTPTEVGIDVRPGGTIRFGRAWLARSDVRTDAGTLEFAFRRDATAPPDEYDVAILRQARAYLTRPERWNKADTTDMSAAPTRGFTCAPADRQSMFCALYLASLVIAGDYAHFRPAVSAVRQSITAAGRTYRHPLVDFNNDPARSLADIHAALDSALSVTLRHVSAPVTSPTSACDRRCLRRYADDYLAGLAKKHAKALPLAADVKFTENGVIRKVGEGFGTAAGEMRPHRTYVVDPETGGIAVQGVVRENDSHVVFLVRLRVANQQIHEIETLVVRRADNAFFSPEQFPALTPLDVPVPDSLRNTREELVQIADAYFTALHTQGTTAYKSAPFASGANRYENGVLTTNVVGAPRGSIVGMSANEQFDRAVFPGRNVGDRRYPVVDVQNGTILGIVTFRPSATRLVLLLSEIFKIAGGKLYHIRAVMLDRPPGAPTGWE